MFGLSFLYPAFLIGAVSAAIPILLHLLTPESAPKVRFSAVRFLKKAPAERSRRRLRDLLLLVLRVAALLLLAVSFARPFFRAAADSLSVTIVAIDTSFSMSALGQFDRARQLAREAVNGAPADSAVGVLTFSDAAEVVSPVSLSRAEALTAIDGLRPGAGGTRYRPALDRAADIIGERSGRVIVVTDLQAHGWQGTFENAIPASIDVAVADTGAALANLGVTDFRRESATAVAVVRNGGNAERSGRARVALDGRPFGEASFTVAPGASSEVRFAAALPAEGALSVTIDDGQGYQADDVRYLALNRPNPIKVLAVTSPGARSEAFYLERAILAGSDARAFDWTIAGAGSLHAAADLKPYSAVLLLSAQGLDRRGGDAIREYAGSGGGLLIVAGPHMRPDLVRRTLGDDLHVSFSTLHQAPVTFSPVDVRHPIFRAFGPSVADLGRVEFARAVRMTDAAGAEVIARFSDGSPALTEVKSGRILCFASDLNRAWNDFPLRPTFVPFVHETVRYLASARKEPDAYLVADVPPGISREPGVHDVPGSGGSRASRRVAVNVDPAESDLARQTKEQFVQSIPRSAAVRAAGEPQRRDGQEDGQRLWRYGLLAMLVSLVAESAIGRRT